jgi:hypothetical protein
MFTAQQLQQATLGICVRKFWASARFDRSGILAVTGRAAWISAGFRDNLSLISAIRFYRSGRAVA